MKLPLELQNPKGLWLLGALLPLIILYVLKVKRTRVTVASTWLWVSARRDLMARSPFKRLERQIPLLLQAAALILLALALSKPSTRHRAIIGDHVAIVIDTSASMTALAPSSRQPRIELAREAAWNALAALSPGTDAMVIEASRTPRVIAPLDRDVHRLQQSIDKLPAHDVEGDLESAISLAVDRLRQLSGSKRILVFTDGDLARPMNLQGLGIPLELFTVGERIDNAAIVRVDVRSGLDPASQLEEVQAFSLVANYGQRPREVFVTLRLAGSSEVLASRRVLVAPGERAPVVLTFKPAEGDRNQGLVFELSPHDELAADDVAFGRVPASPQQPVVLVSSGGSPWLERALRSDPHVSLTQSTIADLAKQMVDGALYVFDGSCPAQAPPGDFLVVAPPEGDCQGVTVGASVDRPQVTSWAHGDPRLRFLTLDGLNIRKASALKTGAPSQSLVHAQTETLVADASSAGHSGTVVGFDVGESDWPLKASFVLFIRNVLEQARAHRVQGSGMAYAGEPLRVAVPPQLDHVLVDIPGEKAPAQVPARAGLAILSDTQRAGHYVVHWPEQAGLGMGKVLIPVNLTSEPESDLRAKDLALNNAGVAVQTAAHLADAHTDWSWLVALFGLGFLLFDVWWLTRSPRPMQLPVAPPRPERATS